MIAGKIQRGLSRRIARWTLPKTWQDTFGCSGSFHGTQAHLRATLGWMDRAIAATQGRGVAAHYTVGLGWGSAYPETTGYIVPTLFSASERLGLGSLAEQACSLADWLLTTQKPSGGFPGGELKLGLEETVFNTGQILRGLIAAHQRRPSPSYLSAIGRAAEWLCSVQSEDGAWNLYTSPLTTTREHAYDVLTAYGLYQAGQCLSNPRYLEAAERQASWTVAQQMPNGFFKKSGFEANAPTLTHPLAYVAEGLCFMSGATGKSSYFEAAQRLLAAIVAKYGRVSALPGYLDEHFEGKARWSCVTGNIQFGLVAMWIYERTEDRAMGDFGRNLIERAASTQILGDSNPGLRGGVFGSSPISGRYFPYSALNWAAKYLIDALLQLEKTTP